MESLTVFCDGGARGNPGPAATGVVIIDSRGQTLYSRGQAIGRATNNVAEYQAVITALTWLAGQVLEGSLKPFSCRFFLDSTLVVNQITGRYKVKQPHLRLLLDQVKRLRRRLPEALTFTAIPRARNARADLLVNHALDSLHG